MLSSSANPSVFGQPVTVTAAVAPVAPGAGTPTGSVVFTVDGAPQPAAALSGGQATLSTAAPLSLGGHAITATYGGDTNFSASPPSQPLTQTVTQASTTTALSSSANPSVSGQAVTLRASVAPATTGGTVIFTIDGTPGQPVTLHNGTATSPVAANLGVGPHSITATYQGSANFAASTTTSPLIQVVNRALTSTGLSSSNNRSPFGQAVTFTARVSVAAPGAGIPTGAVDFADTNGAPLGTGTLGQANRAISATLKTSSLTSGAHTITGTYRGDARFASSTSQMTQTVTCTVISGTRQGALTITGSTCLQGATVNGAVTVAAGGSLAADHSTLNGNLTSNGATAVRLCTSKVNGTVSLTKTTGFILIGDGADSDDVGAAPCDGNTINGAVSVVNSSGSVELGGNSVSGAVSLSGGTGPAAELERNHVTGALMCTGNVPPPTDDAQPNVAGTRAGQCGAPGF